MQKKIVELVPVDLSAVIKNILTYGKPHKKVQKTGKTAKINKINNLSI